MVKKILLVVLLTGSLAASAQLRLGVKVGGNFMRSSDYRWITQDDKGIRRESVFKNMYYGGHAGGYANYAFSERWGMQGEVLIAFMNGAYLDIPLLATFKPLSNLPVSLMAGGQLSMTPTTGIGGYDSNKAGSPIDFFPALTVGAQYDFGKHLNIGLRYNHGFVNEYDLSYSTPDAYHSQEGYHSEKGGKHRTVQLSVGWTF